ncbi:uncharacterized protein LTR77_002426 [Saxophila tyrrhenica]|uniref:Uncharacterized protein n=1 Tax=Saxophila tyrrhenica TaxID=1690608 RepID=A0AAV9PLZ0_9PEZI|nr:hypothetical protein LTR77_002426 [Saxophila tyrrhenica]
MVDHRRNVPADDNEELTATEVKRLRTRERAQQYDDESCNPGTFTPPNVILSANQKAAVRDHVGQYGFPPGRYIDIDTTMLGLSGVGQDCLHVRLNQDAWWTGYDPFQDQSVNLLTKIEGVRVCFNGWTERPSIEHTLENCSVGRNCHLRKARHCEVWIMTYDVADRKSSEALRVYHDNFLLERRLERDVGGCKGCYDRACPPRPPFRGLFFVIANKVDLPKPEWKTSIEEGQGFCASIGAIFMPMSAKTGEGSGTEALSEMAYHVLWRRVQYGTMLEAIVASHTKEPAAQFTTAQTGRLCTWFARASRQPTDGSLESESKKSSVEEQTQLPPLRRRARGNPNFLYRY